VCRRNNDPNTWRPFFESSEARDANEPVLEFFLYEYEISIEFFIFFCLIN
jgi:hypothetical protein